MNADSFFYIITLSTPPLLIGLSYLFFRKFVTNSRHANLMVLLSGNILVFLALASLSFACVESYYHFLYDETIGDNRSKVSRRWFKRYWHRNNMKVRDNINYKAMKKAGKRRITFIGDSFTAGHGVPNVEDRFVNQIRKSNPEWEVHMFAHLGLSSVSQFILLQNLISSGHELDVVILVYCYNDIEPFVGQIKAALQRGRTSPPSYLSWIVEHSYAVNTFYHHYRRRQSATSANGTDYFSLMKEAYTGQPWQTQILVLQQIKKTVEENGGTFAVVTFPLLLDIGKEEISTHFMHKRLNILWEKLNIPHLDLLHLLKSEERSRLVVNQFDDHPSAYTHGVIEEAIKRFIIAEVL